jgi:hypothetical protein
MQIFLSSIAKKTGRYLVDFCSGNLARRVLLRIFLPVILAAYFGSLIFAIWSFPGLFDWRTMSMSKLLYPSKNPRFHAIGSAGLVVAGLMTIPFAGYIGRRLRDTSPVLTKIGALSFGAGAISLTLGALIVREPFLHEMFARGAGLGVGLGMLAFYLCVLRARSVPANEPFAHSWVFLAWSLIVPPALLVVVLRLLAAARFQWSNPVYLGIEKRSLWHLGFWEWIGSTAVFLFILSAALLLTESASQPAVSSTPGEELSACRKR